MIQRIRIQIELLIAWGFRQEFLRYALSGAAAFSADIIVYLSLTEGMGVHYLQANVAGFAVGLVVSYIINVKWVFHHRVYDGANKKEIFIFVAIVITGLTISELALAFFVEGAGIDHIVSKILSNVFVFLFNYFTKKYILFNPNKTAGKAAAEE